MTSINDNDLSGRAVARGLREIADWLDEHPSLTPHAFVAINATERVDLELLAVALGARATERLGYGGTDVEIEGRFAGGARVYARVPVAKLAGKPVQPEYEPILNTTRAAA